MDTINNNLCSAYAGYSDYYLPSDTISVEEYLTSIDFQLPHPFKSIKEYAENYSLNSGIEKLYIEQEQEECHIFSLLIERYFEQENVDPNDIGIIIYTRGYSIRNDINAPYYIQKKYNINNAMVFNIEQGCSGTITAMELCCLFLTKYPYKKALILSASLIQNIKNRYINISLLSDGAGILEINNHSGLRIKNFNYMTEGNLKHNMDEFSDVPFEEKVAFVKKGVNHIQELLQKSSVGIDDVELLIPQNTNRAGWILYCKFLNIQPERVYLENIRMGGHMGDVDIIRNLTDVRQKYNSRSNSKIVLYAIGWGTSWASALLEI